MQSSPSGAVVLNGVDVHRGNTLALDGVTLAVSRGTVAAIMGPNGAGKSTLFGLISGRLRQTTGDVYVSGEVAEVLQTGVIDTHLPLTVEDVVRQGRYRARGLLRPLTRKDRDLIDSAIDAVDLQAQRRTPIYELSGGQRQRAFLAQGIAQQSSILLLDEPTAGVDMRTQRRVGEVIRSVADSGTTVLMSTHSLDDAVECDVMVALAGRCLCCAPPRKALDDPEVAELLAPRMKFVR